MYQQASIKLVRIRQGWKWNCIGISKPKNTRPFTLIVASTKDNSVFIEGIFTSQICTVGYEWKCLNWFLTSLGPSPGLDIANRQVQTDMYATRTAKNSDKILHGHFLKVAWLFASRVTTHMWLQWANSQQQREWHGDSREMQSPTWSVKNCTSINGTTQERDGGRGHDVNISWESSLPLRTIVESLICSNIYAITKLFLRIPGIVMAEYS